MSSLNGDGAGQAADRPSCANWRVLWFTTAATNVKGFVWSQNPLRKRENIVSKLEMTILFLKMFATVVFILTGRKTELRAKFFLALYESSSIILLFWQVLLLQVNLKSDKIWKPKAWSCFAASASASCKDSKHKFQHLQTGICIFFFVFTLILSFQPSHLQLRTFHTF